MLQVFTDVSQGKYVKQTVSSGKEQISLSDRGQEIEGEYIKFDKVPIVSPNGDILVKSISFEVKPGMHLLISGPNGCGIFFGLLNINCQKENQVFSEF